MRNLLIHLRDIRIRDAEQELVSVQLYVLSAYLIQLLTLHYPKEQLEAICEHFASFSRTAPANDEPEADEASIVQWAAEKRAATRLPKIMSSILSLAEHGAGLDTSGSPPKH